MSKRYILIEKLPNGMKVAYIHLPHFRTHSARLAINAGSIHESKAAYGAAHYLEHLCFHGTKDFKNQKSLDEFADKFGLSVNASTYKTFTKFIADGFELERVLYILEQLAVQPTLADESLEKDRKVIIDEIRGRRSDPYYATGVAHDTAIWGNTYGRPILGSVEDVSKITPASIRAFYHKQYQPQNMVLVVSSAETLNTQQKMVEEIFGSLKSKKTNPPQSRVDFGDFNQSGGPISTQFVNQPENTKTFINIVHELPSIKNLRDMFKYNFLGFALNRMAYRRLRNELMFCYEAWAYATTISDLNYGRNKYWNEMTIGTGLDAENALISLQELHEIIRRPVPEDVYESIKVQLMRDADLLLEKSPVGFANRISDTLSSVARDKIKLEEIINLTSSVSLGELHELQQQMLGGKRLILATSPSQATLAELTEWSSTTV